MYLPNKLKLFAVVLHYLLSLGKIMLYKGSPPGGVLLISSYSEAVSVISDGCVKLCFGHCILQMECCGWSGRQDWNGNMIIVNSSMLLFPCSCQNVSVATGNVSDSGFCEAQTPDWPVYDTVNYHIVLFGF